MQLAAGTTIVGAEISAQNSGLPWTTEADLLQLNTNAQDATTTTRSGLQQRLFEIPLPVDRMRREILADPAIDDIGEHNPNTLDDRMIVRGDLWTAAPDNKITNMTTWW